MDYSISIEKLPTKCELNVNLPMEREEELVLNKCVKMISLLDEPVLEAIEFYCNIMSRSKFCALHKISYLKSFKEIQSPIELTELFSNIPQLFSIRKGKVILKNWIVFHLNQQEWLKELLPAVSQSLPNFRVVLCTIQFICNIIFCKGYQYCSKQILTTKIHPAIKEIIKSKEDYINFLSRYPEIFILKGDKVTLTSVAASYRSMTSWMKRLVCDSLTSTAEGGTWKGKSLDIKENDTVTNDTIGFYYSYLRTPNNIFICDINTLFTRSNKKKPRIVIRKFSSGIDLKGFLSCYPDVFTIKSDLVFLTDFKVEKLNESQSDSEHRLNFADEGSLYPKNQENLAIEFYTNILRNISKDTNNVIELPINHLFYYSLEAPQEVKSIAGSVLDFNIFLSKYPNIFKIKKDKIIITESIKRVMETDLKAKNIDSISPDTVVDAVNSYMGLVYQNGGCISMKELLIFRELLNEKIRNITSNSKEIKQFLSSYPEIFSVKNDQVIINEKCLEKMDVTYQAINFFLDCIKKEKRKLLPLNVLNNYRDIAPTSVQEFVTNPAELKFFLSKFSNIFAVIDDSVTFSVPLKHNSLYKEIGCCNLNDSEALAVSYFSRILNVHGNCQVLNIDELIEFKQTSPLLVQEASGSNKKEFIDFLKQYSEYFLITGSYVIARKKIPKFSDHLKYGNDKCTSSSLPLVLNFFIKYTIDKSLFNIDNLYDVGKYFVYEDRSPFFKCKNDLLSFLALYPNIFYVESQRVINLVASTEKAKVFLNRKCQNKKTKKVNKKSDIKKSKKSLKQKQTVKSECAAHDKKPVSKTESLEVNASEAVQSTPEQKLKYFQTITHYLISPQPPTNNEYSFGTEILPVDSNNLCQETSESSSHNDKNSPIKKVDTSNSSVLEINTSEPDLGNRYFKTNYLKNSKSIRSNESIPFGTEILPINSNNLCREGSERASSNDKDSPITKVDTLNSRILELNSNEPDLSYFETITNYLKSSQLTRNNESVPLGAEILPIDSNILCSESTLPNERDSTITKGETVNTINIYEPTIKTDFNVESSPEKAIIVKRKKNKNYPLKFDKFKPPKKKFKNLPNIGAENITCSEFDGERQLSADRNSSWVEISDNSSGRGNSIKRSELNIKDVNIEDTAMEAKFNSAQTIQFLKSNECFDASNTNDEAKYKDASNDISFDDVLDHISYIEKYKWNKEYHIVNDFLIGVLKRPSFIGIENNVFAQIPDLVNLGENKGHQKYIIPESKLSDYISYVRTIPNNLFYKALKCLKPKYLKKLIQEALIYLNETLWEGGELNILTIDELLKLCLIKPSALTTHFSGNLEYFKEFLCYFNDDFIVTNTNVMAKKNKIQQSFVTNESVTVMLANFFDLYSQNNHPITVKTLYKRVGQHFYNANQSKIFKLPEQLLLFLEMFPDFFCVDNDLNVINLTFARKNVYPSLEEGKYLSKINYIPETMQNTNCLDLESSMPWKDIVLKRTKLIEDILLCRHITEAILKSENLIALDCEGINLGAAGILSLVQIGVENGDVFIFDIAKDKTMVLEGGLREILESESIVKVIHDSRNDAANLYTEYGVEMNKIFDTRVAHHLIVNSGIVSNEKEALKLLAIGFNDLCVKYGAPINIEKDEMKNVYKSNYMFWNKRPLTKDMLAYAALDVACLVPQLYNSMLKQLAGFGEKLVWELSIKNSKSALD